MYIIENIVPASLMTILSEMLISGSGGFVSAVILLAEGFLWLMVSKFSRRTKCTLNSSLLPICRISIFDVKVLFSAVVASVRSIGT